MSAVVAFDPLRDKTYQSTRLGRDVADFLAWMELGGAGIFRPELVAPLGVRATVLAWGLGLDRMAMNALGIDDIRQLFTTDLEFMRTAGRGGVR